MPAMCQKCYRTVPYEADRCTTCGGTVHRWTIEETHEEPATEEPDDGCPAPVGAWRLRHGSPWQFERRSLVP